MFNLSYEFDERRSGYWIQGSGFYFFAYFTCGPDDETFVECDHVQRNEEGLARHLQVKLGPSGQVHKDILETAVERELSKHWSP